MSDLCGKDAIRWVEYWFRECTYSFKETTALLLGYISILCWLLAQFPQVYKNYKRGSAECLSLWFLLSWLLGDVSNFVGCVLTEQMPFQIYLATYFVFIDFSLFCQSLYYNHLKPKFMGLGPFNHEEAVPIFNESTAHLSYTVRNISPKLKSFNKVSFVTMSILFLSRVSTALSTSADSVAEEPLPASTTFIIGNISAWLCTFLYLSSRLPQIHRNCQRRSTSGLAFKMFFFAVCGNLSYTLSIFLSSDDLAVWLKSLPFILGSGGTLIFDAIIFGQWWWFRRKETTYSYLSRDEVGRNNRLESNSTTISLIE